MYLLLVYLIINTMGVPSCCGESTIDIRSVATIQHATVGRIETGWACMQDDTGAYTFWSQLDKLQALLDGGVDTVHIIVGWHTPKWGSRAKWILDNLCEFPPAGKSPQQWC